jgi:pyroglutamyl-peptidase
MAEPIAVVTGFEPFGGRDANPSAEVARALDGERIAGARVQGHVLPVSLERLPHQVDEILSGPPPAAVISLGLAPGEPMIRLERVGLNLAQFDIPDNDGRLLRDAPVEPGGADGCFATLPLRRIERRLLAAGIPARLSLSAGAYLCNATLYAFLRRLRERAPATPCGFVHLPLLPAQVAQALAEMNRKRPTDLLRFEPGSSLGLPSMDLATQTLAVRLVIEETLAGE